MSSLLLHHGWYDCTDMSCSSFLFTFSLPSFDFLSFLSYYLFLFLSHSTPIHLPYSTPFFMIYRWLDHFSSFLISPSKFPWTPFKFTCSWDFSMHYTISKGMDLIIGYLSLVSLHFFHPITLAYVTSYVWRPPWGHEIRRYLWQFSLGRTFVDWLKYSCYYVFTYRKYFWKHLVSLSCLTYRCLIDF